MKIGRRDMLKGSLLAVLAGAGVGFGIPVRGLVGKPPAGAPLTTGRASLDAYETLSRAVRTGRKLDFGLEGVAHADTPANTAQDLCVVTIKVMNLIHTPLCFKLGEIETSGAVKPYSGATQINGAAYGLPWTAKLTSPDVASLLVSKGLDQLSDDPRFRELRFNKWWADLLRTGLDETGAAPAGLAADVAPFPAEAEVAMQAALSLSQRDTTLNHSFQNMALAVAPAGSGRGGDLAHHVTKQGLVRSPFGLACFNMGSVVETTDAIGNVSNRVVSSDLVSVEATGQSVSSYVRILRQAVGLGLVDEELVQKFDGLVSADSTIATALRDTRAGIQSALAVLDTTAALEAAAHGMGTLDASAGNQQATGPATNETARSEFLAQCKFVKTALDIPGKPFRNFSLLLNIVDLDGAKLDDAKAISTGNRGLTYVEGMRQLAIGLNILAQAIKKHRNVYVVVVSEGGRGANGGDNKVSHAMLMGPGGAGALKDFLYADKKAINDSSDSFVTEPNEGRADQDNSPGLTRNGSGLRPWTDKLLVDAAGNPVAPTEFPTNASFLHGVVRHLETRRGALPTTTGLGTWVKLVTA